MTYFIDHLTLQNWLFWIFPRLIAARLHKKPCPSCCYVIKGSSLAFKAAQLMASVSNVSVQRFQFRQVEMKDSKNLHIYTRIEHKDKYHLVALAQSQPAYKDLARSGLLSTRLSLFLASHISRSGLPNVGNPRGCLAIIQACAWLRDRVSEKGSPAILFLERRPWFGAITQYACENSVSVVATPASIDVRKAIKEVLPLSGLTAFRNLRKHITETSTSWVKHFNRPVDRSLPLSDPAISELESLQSTPSSNSRVAVEYWGNLNLDRPDRHSELFFWQQSGLSGRDVVVTFALSQSPLDGAKWREITDHGMTAIALHPSATIYPKATSLDLKPTKPKSYKDLSLPSGPREDTNWLKREIKYYDSSVAYWKDIFSSLNAKVFISWYKAEAQHCAVADALQSLGGLSAIYQRSYYVDSSIIANVGPNIVFGYSGLESTCVSSFSGDVLHWVTTGYIGDHRFPMLQDGANSIRLMLHKNGARRIVAFFDDNSGEDPRWSLDYQWMRDNYIFLLERVLTEEWFGLLIKPKVPGMLRFRLGPVAELLERAESTGRCFVYESGEVFGSHPPAEAAMAADVAIDCKTYTGSAALDAALSGTPTLIMDREGWSATPLYKLAQGQVIFADWDSAWTACKDHWSSPTGTPGFGDWSPILNEIDPFRDGRAAERTGDYIQWLVEGFKAGKDRLSVIEEASERYAKLWGDDKVHRVR